MFKKWHGNPWAILATLSLGFFMTLLDLTIVNIAIPQLGEDLDASLDEILWVVNAYTLALAVLLITGGASATCAANATSSPPESPCSPWRASPAAWPGTPPS